ncbi:zinc-dependent metalloprotease [Ornithinimicrobium sp. INDO-MA30-4]|uniref:zinc-dependent metalloprotease n=1 Tax=Ornithinimicrobium sp. INDO-MA30-4 TaxID=2908651 RepID=UPI0021A355BF|nr:zinc-dependent metalloprotease [Ornithinimicrobium sp. INDO-MA30-4]
MTTSTGVLLHPLPQNGAGRPKASRVQVKDVVSELRRATQLAIDPVAETSGLQAPPGAAPPLVVDRAGWISANVESARGMLGPSSTRRSTVSATSAWSQAKTSAHRAI